MFFPFTITSFDTTVHARLYQVYVTFAKAWPTQMQSLFVSWAFKFVIIALVI